MRKILLIIAALFCFAGFAQAKTGSGKISVDSIEFLRRDSRVDIRFCLKAEPGSVRSSYSMVLVPVIANGTYRTEMPPVVVQGRKARRTADTDEIARLARTTADGLAFLDPGKTLDYRTTLAFESWMEGAELRVEGFFAGCCSAVGIAAGILAADVMTGDSVVTVCIAREEPVSRRLPLTAMEVARSLPFFVPLDEFGNDHDDIVAGRNADAKPGDRADVGELVGRNRDGSLTIYYRQAVRVIQPGYHDNGFRLRQLTDAVDRIERSDDSRVARILIAGFVSPEGPEDFNTRLAWDRAVAVKDYILANTTVDAARIRVTNGFIDWQGLREAVAGSDMPNKTEVLNVLDDEKISDRLPALRRIANGEAYRYIYKNFFPELRNAAYIRVYYDLREE